MGWMKKVSETIRKGVRSWLEIQESNATQIMITETLDYEANAIKNRIWYRGDSDEIQQMYAQINTGVDAYKFWACRSTPGMEIRKIHTGLPSLIVDTLASIALSDLEIKFAENQVQQELWDAINTDNLLLKAMEKSVKEVLYIGDGAFKVSFDKDLTDYPIVEFYPGDRIELVTTRGRIREVVFKTVYTHEKRRYVLHERYGYGYIKYALYYGEQLQLLNSIPQTKELVDIAFSGYKENENGDIIAKGEYMLAVPIKFYDSGKWENRGQSIFDKKVDNFDAFDESWSQWMDALRAGRSKEYIPESLIPRNPTTGEITRPNHFDNRYIATGNDMAEDAKNRITLDQPAIPHESYVSTYSTALDLCLQGLISPSTLGIDMKKLDNADAQREKEKATLYTRDTIIDALQEDIPHLVKTILMAHYELEGTKQEIVEITAEFGDYANPSFESKVETVGKGKTQGIMSIEASVDELYGDDKTDDWKKDEVVRLKKEQGIEIVDEPSVAGDDIPPITPIVGE